ncbi:MAG: hypothetical protein CMG75_05545 [Candidatus Marinimicrobia bacterium]|nr:hypothetical protein [Candidatus Neomarinimicrobiota bacterium]|tara:strand:- start:8694 stop:9242 length:549 start_codon:yes stop_codon:yes gene_type:complete
MIPVEVTKISFYPPSKGYAVFLQEIAGENRKLPVIVGSFEAQSIALAMEKVDTPRPMTHDLLTSILEEMEIHVKAVIITDLSEGTFYAGIRIDLNGEDETEVDSRPSDAIAVALRLGIPIFVEDIVMKEASVNGEDYSGGSFEELVHGHDNNKQKILEEKLKKAIDDEEYEKAAEIRDQLAK